ncbi:MAG TPA: DUF1634 domain-containing protein [Pararobbsia sp.]|nr:DUF1634 domain-containing protein [Pararobbsia sp.]
MRRPTSMDTAAHLERWLAALLQHGTWIAAAIVAAGLAMALSHRATSGGPPMSDPAATFVMTAGIALFIVLPIARLILMLGVFLHQRDYRFSAIAALVLIIVVAGSMVGAM